MAYTRLKYIESNGTQWIDTGFNPDGNTRIVAEMQLTELVNADKGTSPMLFGAYASSSARYAFYWSATGNVFGTYYAGQSKDFSSITNGYTRVQIDCNKNNQSLNGETITYTASTSACSYPLYLFGRNTSGSAGFLAKAKLYSCQIYDNDVLVRDYVPMANEQGVCGLYDNVSHVFYTSPNGNNFFGVREDNGLPVGYTQCEYIESNGTQYIDTGVIGQANIKAESEIMLMEGGASIPLGCYSPSRLYMISFDSNTYLRYGYSEWVNTSTKVEIGRKYSISVDFASGNQSMVLDGVTIASSSISGRVTNNYNIYAFAYNDGGRAGDFSKIKLYGLKLYQDGLLVRDYIPCQNSEGDYGLYDLVNNVFYQSASEYGFTGKWAEDKKLLVSPSEFRKRLMMLAKGVDKSLWRGVFIEDTTGDLWRIDDWNGSATFNSVAVISDRHSFGLADISNTTNYIMDNSNWDDGLSNYACALDGDSRSSVSSITAAYGDYDGEGNTDKMTPVSNAARMCRSFVFNNGKKGYLMSAGEYKMIADNLDEINRALSKIGGKTIRLKPLAYQDGGLCTSTRIRYGEIKLDTITVWLTNATFADAWIHIDGYDYYDDVNFWTEGNVVGAVPNCTYYLSFDSGSYRDTRIGTTVKPACRLLKY